MSGESTNGVADSGREPMTGRFTAGHQHSKGNGVAQKTRELRQSIFKAAAAGDVEDVIRKLVEKAKGGDTPAAKLFLEYTCGKPIQSVELTGKDGESLGLEFPSLLAAVMGALSPYPEARFAVAASLRKLGADDGLPQGDQPGA